MFRVQSHITCFVFLFRMNSDTVDYEDACLVVRYLASMRPFAQSFDIYLTQVRKRHLHSRCTRGNTVMCNTEITFLEF